MTLPVLMKAALLTSASAATAPQATTVSMTLPVSHCQAASMSPAPTPRPVLRRPPSIVTGNVTLYVARYTPSGELDAEMTLGDVDQVVPLASTYKTMVVYTTLKDVDRGRLRLEQPLETTPANRSIEAYPKGKNSVLKLAKLAIAESDNTASDILQLTVTPRQVYDVTAALDPCTTIMVTSKAMWTAMAGLAPGVVSGVTPATFRDAAQRYAALPVEERLRAADALNTRAQQVTADAVLRGIDRYFTGPMYHVDNDAALHNTSTPRAYANLTARVLRGAGQLTPASQDALRRIMASGCCTKTDTPMPFTPLYWGAKAGSGWGLLTMTGYMELDSGESLAYMYVNHDSRTRDSEILERQIRPVLAWIVQNLDAMRSEPGQ